MSLLRHRILALADRRPYILPARAFFQTKNAHEKKNSWLRNLIRRFSRIRPRPLARKHSRRRPRHFHLAQQPADFLFSRHRLLLLFRRLSALQILSLILATIGVALIGSPEFSHNNNAAWGFVSGVVSGAMLALSMVFVRKTHEQEKVGLFPLMMILSFGGAMALVTPSLLFDAAHLYPKTLNDVILVSIYGIVMQCFAWALIAYAIPLLSLSLTGLLLLSEPVAAMLIDYFWLDKPINTVQWSGATLTLLAIYLGSLKDKK